MSIIKNILVCGLGRIGWYHAEACGPLGGFHLAGVCDEDPVVLTKAWARWGVPVYDDWRTMLETAKADAVVIATPSHLHYEMVLLALRLGFHVIVEKPVAAKADEVREMMAEAALSQRLLTVCQTLRYQPDTLAMKRLVEGGFVGRADHISLRRNTGLHRREDWQIWRRYNGGVLSNMGVHLVDSILHVCEGRWVRKVFASLRTLINQGDTEDAMNVSLCFNDGSFAEIEIYRGLLDKPMWELYGDKGTITMEGKLPRMELRSVRVGQPVSVELVEFDKGLTNLEAYYVDLQKALSGNESPPVSMESVLRQMEVVDAIRQSAMQQAVVEMPIGAEVELEIAKLVEV